jgi:hypothetical protein
MITPDQRWSLPRGNTPVPSRWQATSCGRGLDRGRSRSCPAESSGVCPACRADDCGQRARWQPGCISRSRVDRTEFRSVRTRLPWMHGDGRSGGSANAACRAAWPFGGCGYRSGEPARPGSRHGRAALLLFWSSPDRSFDLDKPFMRRWLYQTVLREACRPHDLTGYMDRDTLIGLWPQLRLPSGVRRAWEELHPVLRTAASQAG